MTLEVIPNDVPVGAEIRGVDLSSSVTDECISDIVDALHEYSVIFLRNQNLSEQAHVELTRRIGPLRVPRKETQFLVPGNHDLTRLSNILVDGKPIGAIEVGQYWHTDRSFAAVPNGYAFLYALEIPHDDNGKPLGDTQFSSAKYAYKSLPDSIKSMIAGRQATHFYKNPFRTKQEMAYESESDTMPPVHHPVVRTHPKTGELCLYVNQQYTWSIDGMDAEESRKLLNVLIGFINRPDVVYRHHWQAGDVLLWDDCSGQHCAIGDYKLPQRRLLRRTTVAGTTPV